MSEVPPVDAEPDGGSGASEDPKVLEYQMRGLEAEVILRGLQNAEIGQRHSLRWWSVTVTSFLILLLIFVLFWVIHNIHLLAHEKVHTTLLMAIFIAPIVSLTTLSVALLVASFRGYKDGDANSVVSVASESTKALGISN